MTCDRLAGCDALAWCALCRSGGRGGGHLKLLYRHQRYQEVVSSLARSLRSESECFGIERVKRWWRG